jgi:Domain of unknown function (DUF4258)
VELVESSLTRSGGVVNILQSAGKSFSNGVNGVVGYVHTQYARKHVINVVKNVTKVCFRQITQNSLVENLLGNIRIQAEGCYGITFSIHALQRMAERGVTREMIENLLTNGRSLEYFNGTSNVVGFQLGSLFATFTKEGKLITTFNDASINYIELLFRNHPPI